ncbi:type IV toxin-antitoxin system AbiEi family antitoxin [Promicromonospora iranensis]|uniref:Helix-turn-helix protein n=1 Tax=Promicromonospora iranensis TaxID=1105144 RepID=A0ABU2CN16_9MICO|nr:type IV toxin-antitoxin system AbiEi family antitoxin [Promicromonospora iranensis]MDR7382666.1 hypothetical protein [Promicromonospora iranensis]
MAKVNDELQVPAALLAGLAELGLEARAQAGATAATGRAEVTVSRAAAAQRFDMLWGRGLRVSDLAGVPRGDLPRFVFTDYVPDTTGAAFRRAGVQYLDEAGNAWISFSSVLVDVRGRRRIGSTVRSMPRGNLFSPGSAQVVFALLAWPVLWRATRREVAHVAGVSLGKAHDALATLEGGGFGPDAMRRPDEDLLELWAAAYPAGLGRSLLLGTFHGSAEQVRPIDRTDRLYISGEVAADSLLRPATLDVYVAELKPRLALVNRWRTDGTPNIVVRRSFWREPPDTRGPGGGGPVPAPWPLVYADLLASTDPRVRAAAREWKDRHAQSLWRP